MHSSNFFRADWQVLGKSYDCPNVNEIALKSICKCPIPNHYKYNNEHTL